MEPFIPKSIRSAPKFQKFNRGRPKHSWSLCFSAGGEVPEVTVEDEDDDEKRCDSSEAVLHEFVYRIKNYFLESERSLRVPRFIFK